jgi:hypothetical protein
MSIICFPKKKFTKEINLKTLTCAIAQFEFAFKCFEKVCKQKICGASTIYLKSPYQISEFLHTV